MSEPGPTTGPLEDLEVARDAVAHAHPGYDRDQLTMQILLTDGLASAAAGRTRRAWRALSEVLAYDPDHAAAAAALKAL